MKINAPSMAAFHRETPKASQAMRAERMEQKTAATESGKNAPPGLERALARLEAMGEGDRTAGQTNAMDRIGRNLARYIETQAMAGSPETAVTEATAPQADTPPVDPSEGPEVVPVADADADAGDGEAVEVSEAAEVPEPAVVPDEGALLAALMDSAEEEPAAPTT